MTRPAPDHPQHDCNPSANPSLWDVVRARAQVPAARRDVLRGALGGGTAALLAVMGAPAAGAAGAAGASARLGFTPVAMDASRALTVPPGYTARVLYAWGDPVGVPAQMPPFKPDATATAAEQALQAGMHHDGAGWFPLASGAGAARHGLLACNHEYTDENLLHPDGMRTWSAEKTAKSLAAHGVSIVELRDAAAPGQPPRWEVVRPSRHARRITASTPMRVAGPAAGHALLRTAADPQGLRVLGTFNNCACGVTPWGTYLTCEENFYGYFEPPVELEAEHRRWGLSPGGRWHRWHEHEERFDLRRHPNEFNRFGWVVEIDPHDPASTPVKRTALGRAMHEGATCAVLRDGRVAVFMGEDARFEYLYRFVSRDAVRPGGAAANRDLLDHGTLSVARFDADGRGRWLPLRHGQGPLTPANGFADAGEVVIKTRQASDLLGGTKMDRPEWAAVDAASGWVYVSLTNNSARGRAGLPGADAANPRAPNPMGHVLRWKHHGDLGADTFDWEIFALGGGPEGDAFGGPDGLMIDARGLLWICTDHANGAVSARPGDRLWLPRNQLLVCDPAQGTPAAPRRFLVAPVGAEVTGPVMLPDQRTLLINIQHPGVDPQFAATPEQPWAGAWPQPGVRPRSATVVITREDGGLIGT